MKTENTVETGKNYQHQAKNNCPETEKECKNDNPSYALMFKCKEYTSSTALSEYQISRLTEYVSFLEN